MSMKLSRSIRLLSMLALLGGCASMLESVQTPVVNLTDVQLTRLGLGGQTFELGFNVSNPNAFPLPVKGFSYGVSLAGQSFASGNTLKAFTVPADGDGKFNITVNADLLRSVSQLSSLLKSGTAEQIPYELNGSFAINLPFVKKIPIKETGTVAVSGLRF